MVFRMFYLDFVRVVVIVSFSQGVRKGSWRFVITSERAQNETFCFGLPTVCVFDWIWIGKITSSESDAMRVGMILLEVSDCIQ